VPETTAEGAVKIRAHSRGIYPILVVELPEGGLRTTYFETGYDLDSAKEVGEGWLRDNAIGRHSFVEVSPPREMQAGSLKDYVNRELLKGDRGERRRTP
jgi:hypothetical protein